MLIDVLNIKADGTQELQKKEVPDDYLSNLATLAPGQISDLKRQLEETDYKIIKCSEAGLIGVEMPYDVAALHAERQAIRDQINALEATL